MKTTKQQLNAEWQEQAFTLLELLLAVFVFAIVLSALHVVFFSAFRLQARTTDAIERDIPLQQTLAVIKRDIANLAAPGGTLSGALQSTPTISVGGSSSTANRGNSPAFYTAVGIVDDSAPWGEIEKVTYALQSPTDRSSAGLELHRVVTRNLLPTSGEETSDQYLMSGVEKISFQFYDGNAWRDTWDSTTADATTGLSNNLPRGIKMVLQLYSEDYYSGTPAPVELIVPVMVATRTNVTAEIEGTQ